jgi:hypothetical protein
MLWPSLDVVFTGADNTELAMPPLLMVHKCGRETVNLPWNKELIGTRNNRYGQLKIFSLCNQRPWMIEGMMHAVYNWCKHSDFKFGLPMARSGKAKCGLGWPDNAISPSHFIGAAEVLFPTI